MYNVIIEKAEYGVKFHHFRVSSRPVIDGSCLKQKCAASTLCWIVAFVSGEKEVGTDPGIMSKIGDGIAYCHKSDIFNKNTGRKLSLARALKDAGFDRNVRELFWRGYFEARGRID